MAGAHCVHQIHQQWTQDRILLLDRLVTVVEEWLADLWAWCTKDITCGQERVIGIQRQAPDPRGEHITLLKRMLGA